MKQIIYTFIFTCLVQTIRAQTPPATWQEHWFEHNQLLNRKFYDNDVAVYYDNDVSSSVTWPYTYMGDVWRYVKNVYGSFGSDPHLFAIYHTNKYSGGHPSTYFDASHDNRNVIDVGPGPWTSGGTGGDLDISTHEVAHIVEGASKGVKGSPAFPIWGDSKWAEIFIYDVYLGLGKSTEATRWYNQMQNSTDNFPVTGTHWFRDWFYPIYHNYGGTQVLNRFFTLLAQYFPKSGNSYSRDMNWGEFIHFWSGAAGVSLKPLATAAFGWTTTFETQFNQARNDFPFAYGTGVVSVYKHCNYGGYVTTLGVGNYTLSQLQNMGVLNDDISSVKVNSGYQLQLFQNDNFTGTSVTLTADASCLVPNNFNDVTSSLKVTATSVAAARETTTLPTDSRLAIYPNPVVNELRFNTTQSITGATLRILDVMGREVLSGRLVTNHIDVSKLAAGAYTLVIINKGNTISQKFVKSH
ncbi:MULTISPECIES: T9SS type A sorting domain-containing protein [Niastella]|uniref:T9SS type A sorting domain-containing protein n=1 Tax=Niastella soli TaxID=2821487 RepID=A0ABS3Z477_9BACT|nr:T9SS type A sorting domain-containing protein [Niastella soli]MBO9204967.1 T9SS type A sorting domain-containing protein [Niastella soli]